MKNIIIRDLTKEDNRIIEEVKEQTGEKTASKAVLRASSEYLLYRKKYYDIERRYFKLIDKLESLKNK